LHLEGIETTLLSAYLRMEEPMQTDERLDILNDQHATLERAIEEENLRPYPDDIRLSELKREKLRIKDEIHHHVE